MHILTTVFAHCDKDVSFYNSVSGIRQSLFTDCYRDEWCITSRHLLVMLLQSTKGKPPENVAGVSH